MLLQPPLELCSAQPLGSHLSSGQPRDVSDRRRRCRLPSWPLVPWKQLLAPTSDSLSDTAPHIGASASPAATALPRASHFAREERGHFIVAGRFRWSCCCRRVTRPVEGALADSIAFPPRCRGLRVPLAKGTATSQSPAAIAGAAVAAVLLVQ